MMVDFKTKFTGDERLAKTAGATSGALTLLLWFLAVEPQVKAVCAGLLRDDGTLSRALLTIPVNVGYLLFYWTVISWIVYFFAKRFYRGQAGPRA